MIPPFDLNASAWVQRWAGRIPPGRVLDMACGGGRHAVYLAGLGQVVVAVDRDLTLAAQVRNTPGIAWRQADLEAGPWPFSGETFQGIVVTNYLHRPLFDAILASLAPGGVLIYETFSLGQAKYGRPRNPAHLLLPGELLETTRGRLRVLAYEDVEEVEKRRCVQRLCAYRNVESL
jgi:SAM-dependent methyltransferase